MPIDRVEPVVVRLFVTPISKGRVRVTSRGTYTPKRTLQAEAELKDAYESLDLYRFEGPVEVEAVFFPEWIDLGIYPTHDDWMKRPTGDVDNLMKTLGDGLNGVAWRDDKQIKAWRARKAVKGET